MKGWWTTCRRTVCGQSKTYWNSVREGKKEPNCCFHPPVRPLRCRKSFIFHSRMTGRLTVSLTKDRNYEALWNNDFFRLKEKDSSAPMGATAPKQNSRIILPNSLTKQQVKYIGDTTNDLCMTMSCICAATFVKG